MNNKVIYLARRAGEISREDWPKAWKSHAVFASQFPAIEASLEWMRYCNRIDEPTLDGKPVNLPQLSMAHDGVANINRGSNEMAGGRADLPEDVGAALDQDERRVFDMLVREFSFRCRELPIREGLPGKAVLYVFLPRSRDITREEFAVRWDTDHAAIVRRTIGGIATISRYGHNHVQGDPPPLFTFHGIAEIWFSAPEDAVRVLVDGALDPIFDDFGGFCDMNSAVYLLTAPCHGWPKDEVLQARRADASGSGQASAARP